jgi:hypothetical protein
MRNAQGRVDGYLKDYYPNGRLRSLTFYSDGLADGPGTYYHENGRRARQYCADQSRGLLGRTCAWDNDGRMIYDVYRDEHGDYHGFYYDVGQVVKWNGIRYYDHGVEIGFQKPANERCKQLKEDLMKVVNHPDRLERIANAHGLDLLAYLERIDS